MLNSLEGECSLFFIMSPDGVDWLKKSLHFFTDKNYSRKNGNSNISGKPYVKEAHNGFQSGIVSFNDASQGHTGSSVQAFLQWNTLEQSCSFHRQKSTKAWSHSWQILSPAKAHIQQTFNKLLCFLITPGIFLNAHFDIGAYEWCDAFTSGIGRILPKLWPKPNACTLSGASISAYTSIAHAVRKFIDSRRSSVLVECCSVAGRFVSYLCDPRI